MERNVLTEAREACNWKIHYLFWHQKIRSAFCCTNRAPSCMQKPSNTTPHSPHRCLCYCRSRKTKMNRSRQATSTRNCCKNTVRIQIYLTVKSLDSIPDPRRSHMSRSSQPRAPQLLRVCSRDQGLQVLSTEPMYWNSGSGSYSRYIHDPLKFSFYPFITS